LKQASAFAVGFAGLHTFMGCGSDRTRPSKEVGFGELQPDPDGMFDLPEGFSYRVVSRHGELMDDGFRVPHRPDGMATFPGPGDTTILVRNHEVDADAPRKKDPSRTDSLCPRQRRTTPASGARRRSSTTPNSRLSAGSS
jgi:secreted PhoX family phosphatase